LGWFENDAVNIPMTSYLKFFCRELFFVQLFRIDHSNISNIAHFFLLETWTKFEIFEIYFSDIFYNGAANIGPAGDSDSRNILAGLVKQAIYFDKKIKKINIKFTKMMYNIHQCRVRISSTFSVFRPTDFTSTKTVLRDRYEFQIWQNVEVKFWSK